MNLPNPKWCEALNELPLCLPVSAWIGHVPFLFLLFKLANPRTYVELGVDLGTSFLAACEAAHRFHTGTRCFGVDTWHGDRHAGYIDGNAIFEPMKQFVAARYPTCALIRQTFDRAVGQFEDSSVDILHIDGLHTYEAVSHDFAAWLPKLSNQSIVLFHDIEVRHGDFGVWRFWDEIRRKYRHFEFDHSFGLGVLLTGASFPAEFEELVGFISANPDQARLFKDICNGVAADVPRRMQERGLPIINEIAFMKKLVMQKRSARLWAYMKLIKFNDPAQRELLSDALRRIRNRLKFGPKSSDR